jgi:hypothetical protein
MRFMDEIRWIRVLGFATVYFSIYVALFVYSTITHMDPYDLTYLLQNPWIAPYAILGWLIRNLVLILTFFTLMLYSFIYGFITDWVLRTLKKRILLRKDKQGAELNRPRV